MNYLNIYRKLIEQKVDSIYSQNNAWDRGTSDEEQEEYDACQDRIEALISKIVAKRLSPNRPGVITLIGNHYHGGPILGEKI